MVCCEALNGWKLPWISEDTFPAHALAIWAAHAGGLIVLVAHSG